MKPALSTLQDKLQKSAVFAGVPVQQLKWLTERANYLCLKKGEYLLRSGDPIDQMALLLKGHILITQQQGGNLKEVQELKPGDVSGALPYSRAKTAIAQSIAQEESELLMLPKEFFREMIQQHHELTEVLVHTMTSRVRTFTESRQQSEKMAALGKLSAGLAHELNNPAAAVVRSSSALKRHLTSLPDLFRKILSTPPDEKALNQVHQLFRREQAAEASTHRSLLEKNSLEEELAEWLKNNQIPDPYQLAAIFTDLQLQKKDIEMLSEHFNATQLPLMLAWVSQLLSIEKLADEIHDSSCRISELVQSVKSNSHMDKSPEKEETELLQGIKNTLTMLNFKIKKKGVKVRLKCSDDLPKACVYAGELNQLWTNLIDNAIDAVPEEGEIHIDLAHQNGFIVTSIWDNGEGIPKEEQQKIFDPFYTTKSSGEGSGLGLDIVKRIVDHHEGRIELNSKPGSTQFRINLPV
jgi:signal transduction histidine kinase